LPHLSHNFSSAVRYSFILHRIAFLRLLGDVFSRFFPKRLRNCTILQLPLSLKRPTMLHKADDTN